LSISREGGEEEAKVAEIENQETHIFWTRRSPIVDSFLSAWILVSVKRIAGVCVELRDFLGGLL
jgi:hypothetical protein